MLVTLGLAAAFFLLTLILSLVREGCVAALLAERMSHREKVLMAVILLGFVFAVSVFDERAKKQPFDLPDAVSASAGKATVKVSRGASADEGRGRRLAQVVAREVALLGEYLELEELPPIFVVPRRDLDAGCYERCELDGGGKGPATFQHHLRGDHTPSVFSLWSSAFSLLPPPATRSREPRTVLDIPVTPARWPDR